MAQTLGYAEVANEEACWVRKDGDLVLSIVVRGDERGLWLQSFGYFDVGDPCHVND